MTASGDDTVAGRWLPARPADVYHGQMHHGADDVWVYPQLHTGAGMYVVARRNAPDGTLIRRTAVSGFVEAAPLVGALRMGMRRGGIDAVVGEIDPLAARGRCRVHLVRRNYATAALRIDDGPTIMTCSELWLTPGPHRVAAGSMKPGRRGTTTFRWRQPDVVDVDAYAVIHVRLTRILARVRPGIPRLHRCRATAHPLVV